MSKNLIFNIKDLLHGKGDFTSNYKEFKISDFFHIGEKKVIEQGQEKKIKHYEFKKNDIDKKILGFTKNLIYEKIILEEDETSIYKFKMDNEPYVVKIAYETYNENSINLCLNLIQFNINKLLPSGDRVFFTPQILGFRIFYNKEENISFLFSEYFTSMDYFIDKEKIYDSSLSYWNQIFNYSVSKISLLISIIYNISSKLIFLQKTLDFNHNDLKLDNIIKTTRSSRALDFFFIDLENSRIKTKGKIFAVNDFGRKNKLVKGKDMFCLIHSILARLRGLKLNRELNILIDILETCGLQIKLEFANNWSLINKLPQKTIDFYRETYGSLTEYNENMVPYFLSYLLEEYPESYNPENIILKLDEYIAFKWPKKSDIPLIDKKTFTLARQYQNLMYEFTINGDSTNDSSIKDSFRISLPPNNVDYSKVKDDSTKDDSINDDSIKDDSIKDDSVKDDSTKDDSSKVKEDSSKNKRKYLINQLSKDNSIKPDYYKKYLKYKKKYFSLKKWL